MKKSRKFLHGQWAFRICPDCGKVFYHGKWVVLSKEECNKVNKRFKEDEDVNFILEICPTCITGKG